MGFRNMKARGAGSVLFRGTLPPRAQEFAFLRNAGIALKSTSPEGAHWGILMAHREWGTADLLCLKNAPLPSRWLVEWSIGMTPRERQELLLGRSMVSVTNGAPTGDVLWDRKALLWFLRQVMGQDGVGAMDHGSERFWPREALDFELSNDAPLDIESLYVVHAVSRASVASPDERESAAIGASRIAADRKGREASREPAFWMHTHGLAQLGAFDLDILDPSGAASGDALRSLALAALEGDLQPAMASFELASPGGLIRTVPAEEFMRNAAAHWRAKRDDDPDHNHSRSVVCDPVRGLGKLLGAKPSPSRFFMRDNVDGCVLRFTKQATDQMAERARLTIGLCRRLHEEFEEFEFVCLVKIGYPTDRGRGSEHLWFQVHGFGDGDVDATLVNQPFDIAAMSEGQRGRYSLENVTDWQILTPFAAMTPRDTQMARRLREDPEMAAQLLKLIKMRNATRQPA